MQKIAKDQLLPPGICTLCEGAPSDGQDIVDTLRSIITNFPFKLTGRKYVCEACIIALGNVIGLVSGEQAAKAERRAVVAEAQLAATQDHVAKFAAQFSQAALETASNVNVLVAVSDAVVYDEPAPVVEDGVVLTPDEGAVSVVTPPKRTSKNKAVVETA